MRLITIALSHYCEKVRWALDRSGLSYTEEPHAIKLAKLVARRHGRGWTVPVLITPEATYCDSTEILQALDGWVAPELRLYPAEPEARREVEALEELMDETLGPAVRAVTNSFLLTDPRVLPMAMHGAPRRERWLLRALAPTLRRVIARRSLSPAQVQEAKSRIERVYEQVAELLADGRPYLTGERLTAADLALAGLSYMVVHPPEFPGPQLPLSALDPAHRALIEDFRQRPAGAFVKRLYAEERSRVAAPEPM